MNLENTIYTKYDEHTNNRRNYHYMKYLFIGKMEYLYARFISLKIVILQIVNRIQNKAIFLLH
jgi:hypothetical protein